MCTLHLQYIILYTLPSQLNVDSTTALDNSLRVTRAPSNNILHGHIIKDKDPNTRQCGVRLTAVPAKPWWNLINEISGANTDDSSVGGGEGDVTTSFFLVLYDDRPTTRAFIRGKDFWTRYIAVVSSRSPRRRWGHGGVRFCSQYVIAFIIIIL